jgi:6-pyruvoyltetrahydropterin/6-carboxytetrahydropterin synthase
MDEDGMNMSTQIRIARHFHWEMGHRLPFHTGGCANIHGHSYRMIVELEGYPDANGMLIDYGDMKKLIEPVIAPLDHAFLCDASDAVMKDFLRNNGFKNVIVPFNSTAENLTSFLLEEIWKHFEGFPNLTGILVRLQETDNSYAEKGRSRERTR